MAHVPRDRYTILVLGERGVGKGSLLRKRAFGHHEPPPPTYDPVDDDVHPNWKTTIDGQIIWITPRAVGSLEDDFYPWKILCKSGDVHGTIVVYDITSRATFDSVQAHVTRIRTWPRQHNPLDPVTWYPICLIGNKNDLAASREVETSEGAELAARLGLRGGFFETSAKTGENIEAAFCSLMKEIWRPPMIEHSMEDDRDEKVGKRKQSPLVELLKKVFR